MIMGNIWSSEIDRIFGVGYSLENIGVRNWALDREAALKALEELSAKGIAVLGGDVYAISEQGIESNYDNWYCNRDAGESHPDFVARSISKAIRYIANYNAPAGRVLFAIVPSVETQ